MTPRPPGAPASAGLPGPGRWRCRAGLGVAGLALLAAALAAFLPAGCGGDACDQVETEIGMVCVPGAAGADRQLLLEVREACGTNCARSPACTAVLAGGAVRLTLREDHCYVGSASCDATPCHQDVVPCTVPALPEGDYPLVFRGGPSQVLRVRQGGAGACRLPQPPPAP